MSFKSENYKLLIDDISQKWFKCGLLHREDKPAAIFLEEPYLCDQYWILNDNFYKCCLYENDYIMCGLD